MDGVRGGVPNGCDAVARRDLARALGTVGFVAALRRIRVGPFTEESAISLDKLDSLVHINALEEKLFRIEAARAGIPALPLTESQATRLRHGQAVRVSHLGRGRVYATAAGRPVALAEVADGEVRPVRVFNISFGSPRCRFRRYERAS